MPPTMSKTMSFSILANAWSIGAMLLIGWTTKARLYSIKITIPARMIVTIRTTQAQTRISISSWLRSRLIWNLWWLDNVFLQYRCYEVIRTILGELAVRALATLGREVLWVLAKIPIAVFATN
jgi:hypothetical protein